MMNDLRYITPLALAVALLCGCASRPTPTALIDDGARAAPAKVEVPATPTARPAPAHQHRTQGRADPPAPCTLLTQADLAHVLPDAFGAGEAGETPVLANAAFVPKNCAFHSGDKEVTLTVFPARSPFDGQKESGFHPMLQAVAGLDDEAFWSVEAQELWVARGETTLVLGFAFMDASPTVAIPLMRQALHRLD